MIDFDQAVTALLRSEKSRCLRMEPMSRHTPFRIGGPARVFACPGDERDLAALVCFCREQEIPWAVLGNGSNLLVSDSGYEGVVISMEENWNVCEAEGTRLRAGAGLLLPKASRAALDASLAGLEFACGIPGTVGGALVMNAGAYGREMKDVVRRVRVMTMEGQVMTLEADALELGYRTSVIPKKGYIVLEAELELVPGSRERIRREMEELSAKRRDKQPLEYPSAGSTFKRPAGYFAGKLIDDAGLRGFTVGGAQVSEKHCGFVINRENATAADVLSLCDQVRKRVKEAFGVELELEVKRLGNFEGPGGGMDRDGEPKEQETE